MSALLSEAEAAELMEIAAVCSSRGLLQQAARIDAIIRNGVVESHKLFSPRPVDNDILQKTVYWSRLDEEAKFESAAAAKKYHKFMEARALVMEVDHRIDGCDADEIVKALTKHFGVQL